MAPSHTARRTYQAWEIILDALIAATATACRLEPVSRVRNVDAIHVGALVRLGDLSQRAGRIVGFHSCTSELQPSRVATSAARARQVVPMNEDPKP
jgi:hypothetical protein